MSDWVKLGLSVSPPGHGLMQTHAMVPTPLLLDDRIRVFFAGCDEAMRGRIFHADLSREFPYPVLHLENNPVLDLGQAGCFDADSVNPGHLISRDGRLYLYYIGWHRISADIPYTLLVGLAVSDNDGLSFQRLGSEPVLPPTPEECFFRTAPFVWEENGSWQMLYVGGGEFVTAAGGKKVPIYALKQTASPDGFTWTGPSRTLRQADPEKDEIGFGRPVLCNDPAGNRILMVSVRTTAGYTLAQTPYRPAELQSADLQDVLPRGPEEWDREMTCFGAPIIVDNRELLFYNGNQYGRTGFGIAWRDRVAANFNV